MYGVVAAEPASVRGHEQETRMYIGGGVLVTVLIILLIIYLARRV